MSLITTHSLGLSILQPYQIAKELIVNNNFKLIDALFSSGIISINQQYTPLEASFGDKYIINAHNAPIINNTEEKNTWKGSERNQIAVFVDKWHYVTPKDGMMFWVIDKGSIYVFRSDKGWCDILTQKNI